MSRSADPMVKVSLLRAAEAIFAARGLDAARVEAITRAAGVSKGAFYRHFDSKEDAFREVVDGFLARLASTLPTPEDFTRLPAARRDVLAFVIESDTALFEFLWQNRDFVRIVDGCHGGRFDYLVATFDRAMQSAARAWLDHWQRVGVLRADVDTAIAAHAVHGGYTSLVRAMLSEKRKPPIDAWVRACVSVHWAGLGTPPIARAAASLTTPRARASSRAPRKIATPARRSPTE